MAAEDTISKYAHRPLSKRRSTESASGSRLYKLQPIISALSWRNDLFLARLQHLFSVQRPTFRASV